MFRSERCLRKIRILGTVGEALELDLTPGRGLILWWASVGSGLGFGGGACVGLEGRT